MGRRGCGRVIYVPQLVVVFRKWCMPGKYKYLYSVKGNVCEQESLPIVLCVRGNLKSYK